MKKIKLQILAEDIKSSKYIEPDDCAIARAIIRAELPIDGFATDSLTIEDITYDLRDLDRRVRCMYAHVNSKIMNWGKDIKPEAPKDFEYTLIKTL